MISKMYTTKSTWWHIGELLTLRLDRKDKMASVRLKTPALKRVGLDEISAGFYWATKSCGLDIRFDEDWEGCVRFHVSLPPFSLYLGSEGKLGEKILTMTNSLYPREHRDWYPGDDREIGFRIHHWSLWWGIWHSTNWSGGMPRWRNGCWHFRDQFTDLVFGKESYTLVKGEPYDLVVTMPEGDYLVQAAPQTQTWSRPRSKPIVREGTDLKPYIGIPFPGKGTMSYNCDEDAIFGTGASTLVPLEAALSLRSSVMEYRKQYGSGESWRPEQNPPPSFDEQRARAAARG